MLQKKEENKNIRIFPKKLLDIDITNMMTIFRIVRIHLYNDKKLMFFDEYYKYEDRNNLTQTTAYVFQKTQNMVPEITKKLRIYFI